MEKSFVLIVLLFAALATGGLIVNWIREQAMFAVRVKSAALLFEPLDTSGSKARTQAAHTCWRNEYLHWV